MMRLAILTLDFAPAIGGVQRFLFEVARRLGERNEVFVLTPCRGPLPAQRAFERRLLPSSAPTAFVHALRAIHPDRVLVGHAHPRLLLPAALTAWGRYATLAHGNDFAAAQRRWHRPLFNRLLAASRPTIAVSQASATRLLALGVPQPAVVRPGVDPARFAPAPAPPPGPPVLLTAGRLVPGKGIDTVLCALPTLLPVFPGLRYRVAGDGPDCARLEALARRLGLAVAVEFAGPLRPEEMPAVYRAAHVFVMPAQEEGFGIVYLEASASGLPVVAARSGGAVEAVQEGETGMLVPPGDPAALAQSVQRLLGDGALARRLGQAGRRWVEAEMSWDRAAQEIACCLAGRQERPGAATHG